MWVIRRWNARNANISIYTCIDGINDLEKAIETSLKEHITVRCTKCDKDTTHLQVQNFVFLSQTFALCFT